MGNLHLITGFAGKEHITSADHGSMHQHLLRGGDFVLDAGERFAASIITNNQVRISDGELMMQGRHVKLDPGTYVDLPIDNGNQTLQRCDLIVARYTRDTDTGVEACNLVVLKGIASESNPLDPQFLTGDINGNKDRQHDFPLYRVNLNGLNIDSIDALYEPMPSLYDQISALQENNKASWKYLMPIGYVYISSDPTSPAALFGGTWERLKDRFLLGAGDTYAAGITGGEAENTLTIAEMPNHTHKTGISPTQAIGAPAGDVTAWVTHAQDKSDTADTGGGKPHNNMPPYLTVYMWKRVE